MTAWTSLTRWARMESPGNWTQPTIPLGDGWHEGMTRLLQATWIAPVSRRDRYVGKGEGRRAIPAKSCSPGIAPYLLRPGGRRGERDMRSNGQWTHLILDLDAAPLSVQDLLAVVARAFGGVRHASWTTWSCRDGYASARVLLPLSRTVSEQEIISLFWLARRMVLAAGLPEDSAKPGEPCVDSRCLDGRLFYLPAAPREPQAEDQWGGLRPLGYVSPDTAPILDVDALLVAGRAARAADEGPHLARWPHVPVPGRRIVRHGGTTTSTSASGGSKSASEVRIMDFGALPMVGTGLSVLAWADQHLPTPRTEVGIGDWVFHPDRTWAAGDCALNYETARLHRDEHGRLWAKSWTDGGIYVHDSTRRATVQEEDAAADRLAPPTVEVQVYRLVRDGRYAEALDLAETVMSPSEDLYRLITWALDGLAGQEEEEVQEQAAQEVRDSLSVYADRLAKKAAKARDVPMEVRRGALRALELAGEIVRPVMLRRQDLGLPTSRPHGSAPCGVPLALHHGHDAAVMSARICRDEDCPVHGPVQQARRIAAVIAMPLHRSVEGVTLVGDPMGSRTLHEYRITADLMGVFRRRWSEGTFGQIPRPSPSTTAGRNLSESPPVDGYVAYHLENGEITILATAALVIKRGGRPSSLAGCYAGEIPAGEAAARILDLGLRAVRAVTGEIEGVALDPRVVTGTITSSQTLHLDPEGTVRVAQAAPWLAVGEVPAGALREALQAEGVVCHTRGRGEPEERVTARLVRPDTVAGAVERAGGRPYGRRTRPAPSRGLEDAPPAVDLDGIELQIREAG